MRLKRRLLMFVGSLSLAISLAAGAFAQEQPIWRVVLELDEGTYVQTGIGTIPANVLDLETADGAISGVGYMGQRLPGGGSIRRILKLADGRSIIYEVVVVRMDEGKRFKVTLQPVTPTPQEASQWGIDLNRIETGFMSSYSSPMIINDGDILALDVLNEPRSGARFVDYYLVSNGPPPIKRDDSAALMGKARQFAADEVELSIEGYELWRDGEALHKSLKGEATGRFIWIDIPEVGRVIFTLVPPDDGGFQPLAVVGKNQIIFTVNKHQYEWISKRRIAPGSGVYRLWMRCDQTFSFPLPGSNPGKATAWQVGSAAGAAQKPKRP